MLKTNHVSFPNEISYASRIKNSLVVCMGNEMVLFSPFSLNRQFTGIHHLVYEHTCKIECISGIYTDCEYSSRFFNQDSLNNMETHILILDKSNQFHIIDSGRLLLTHSFCFEEKLSILSICGSQYSPNEFAILTPSKASIFHITDGKLDHIFSVSISGQRIIPNPNSYIVVGSTQVISMSNGSYEEIYNGTISDILINKDSFVRVNHEGIGSCVFRYQNESIGVKKVISGLWDILEDKIICFLNGGHICLFSFEKNSKRMIFNVKTEEKPRWIYAGFNKYINSIVVVVIYPSSIETFEMEHES